MMLLLGLSMGAWAATGEACKRTVGLIRGVNPAVGYMHRNYWDGISRTIQAQLRVAGESFRSRAEVAVRADTDPWLVRVEIRHIAAGEGRQILGEMLKSLPGEQGRRGTDSADTPVGQETVKRELQLIQSLNELEQQLEILSPGWKAKVGDSRLDVLSDALPNRVFFNEGMLRLPFEDVPHALRFRTLVRAASEVSRRSSNTGKMNPEADELTVLIRLQQRVTRLFLLHWAAHDVFSAAAESHTVELDNVFEMDDGAVRIWLKSLSVGPPLALELPFCWRCHGTGYGRTGIGSLVARFDNFVSTAGRNNGLVEGALVVSWLLSQVIRRCNFGTCIDDVCEKEQQSGDFTQRFDNCVAKAVVGLLDFCKAPVVPL